jgi:hypothetical protein
MRLTTRVSGGSTMAAFGSCCFCAVLALSACGDDSGTATDAGNAGTSPSAGRAGQAGAAGSAGSSASAGTTGADAGVAGRDGGSLHWYTSCGHPVCGATPDPHDDPSIPNCSSERVGASCDDENQRCDGVTDCGATLICAKSDPTMGPSGCPRSRARFKEAIDYLGQQQLRRYHDQLLELPLASYRYKDAPSAGPQLGFVIEDIEPSVAVSGDHVNMYGYLSMAVAAIQVQQGQIAELQRELERLQARLGEPEHAVCGP